MEPILLFLQNLFGTKLLGVVEYGSVCRGTATKSSDHDVLVVLESSCQLTRELYRKLDTRFFEIGGRPVSLMLSHLPTSALLASGFWLDVAADGRICFEHKEECLSAFFLQVDELVKSGRLSRMESHGQSFWKRSVEAS